MSVFFFRCFSVLVVGGVTCLPMVDDVSGIGGGARGGQDLVIVDPEEEDEERPICDKAINGFAECGGNVFPPGFCSHFKGASSLVTGTGFVATGFNIVCTQQAELDHTGNPSGLFCNGGTIVGFSDDCD